MASKDYYAILMVHPKAEKFLIDAAYKRLAREYHPDVSNAHNKHERMVEINEAYEVLSDPVRRKLYDQVYEQQFSNNQQGRHATRTSATDTRNAARPQNTTNTQRQTSDAQSQYWANFQPTPPNPTSFGIDSNYLKRASEGAMAWHQRKPVISKKAKWVTRTLCSILGIGITISVKLLDYTLSGLEQINPFAWLLLPLLAEIPTIVAERIHDSHLLRDEFNPRYNPNPDGYKEYAIELAKYESEMVAVYVSRSWIFHLNPSCHGMSSYNQMPKWLALLKGARPCSRCVRFTMALPKRLPPPFGDGYLQIIET